MFRAIKGRKRFVLLSGGLLILILLLAACGGAEMTASAPNASTNSSSHSATTNGSPAQPQSPSKQQKSTSGNVGPQYLIKSLRVDMQVGDTRKVAADIQAWITSTDVRSQSAGIDYEQTGNNVYTVLMNFSVQASMYPQIEAYLRDYAPHHAGTLIDLRESVQDVTNDYIDTQSRLKNLRGEQERLLVLLSQTQALNDILNLEQRLTDVEGQIEDTEAHLNALSGQVAFYNITINLQPVVPAVIPPPASSSWNPGQVLHDAWAAVTGLWEGLATFFIWILAFSVYIIPCAVIVWLIWWRRTRSQRMLPPLASAAVPVVSPPSSND